jgi:YD repeat-containing protein
MTASRTLSGQQRTWRYLWSCESRLLAVTTPDLITWRYAYDALGRRVAKLRLNPDNSVAERTWFSWDGTRLAEQRHSSGHLTSWDYRANSHTPLTQVEVGQQEFDRRFYAIVTDLVGTATELMDSAGNQLAPHNQPAYCPLRFPGSTTTSRPG